MLSAPAVKVPPSAKELEKEKFVIDALNIEPPPAFTAKVAVVVVALVPVKRNVPLVLAVPKVIGLAPPILAGKLSVNNVPFSTNHVPVMELLFVASCIVPGPILVILSEPLITPVKATVPPAFTTSIVKGLPEAERTILPENVLVPDVFKLPKKRVLALPGLTLIFLEKVVPPAALDRKILAVFPNWPPFPKNILLLAMASPVVSIQSSPLSSSVFPE